MIDSSLFYVALGSYLLVSGKEFLSHLWNSLVMRYSASITVTSRQGDIYSNVSLWLRELQIKSLENNSSVVSKYAQGERYMLRSINYGTYIVRKGFCMFMIKKELIENSWSLYDKLTIRVYGRYNTYYNSLLSVLETDKYHGMLRVFPTQDDWRMLHIAERPFDSIFSPEKERIINHLHTWVQNEKFYISHGLSYKTGILLYGEPGTGKSSIIRAIATYMKYTLHLITLSEYKSVSDLVVRLTSLQPESCVVFEDIDCVLGYKEDKDEEMQRQKILQVIFNVLDGAMSPERVIFILTTNHKDQLDDALIRDGRCDLKCHITTINREYAEQMCNYYNVPIDWLNTEEFPINPSYLQQKCLQYRRDEEE